MKIIKEFKEFAVKGNMIDMAIGIIIGIAFNKVVDVLVKQILMPPLSLLTEGVDLSSKKIVLRKAITNSNVEVQSTEVAIGYGALTEAFFDFLVIGIVVFMIVKFMNRLKNKAQDVKDNTVVTPKDIELLSNLKELMEEQNALLKAKNK
jgi:large conductance mechanosensitive channel